MKISFNWLTQFIDIQDTPEKIGELLTSAGLEVEGIEPFESLKGSLQGFVIGEVLTCERHPNADKLSVTTVDIGAESPSPIVCGAPNVAAGQKVVVATIGTQVYPISGESFKISKAKIRGEISEGMICAEDELGLGTSHDGILVLDTQLPNSTPAAEYFKIETDYTIEIGLTPNRADAASHLGVARDLQALTSQKLKEIDFTFPNHHNTTTFPVEVQDTLAAPRYAGVVIKNVKVKPSPEWLQNKLKAIGLSPINNIVDATNYVLHGLGQPLHAFDLDKIEGGKIIVRQANEGETLLTLDDVERKFKGGELVIADTQKPLCIAGVFGGKDSGVSENTTSIFLESAYFRADSVRKTSLTHGLKTDASFRFERGTDPNMPLNALAYASKLILEIAEGEIDTLPSDFYPAPISDFLVETTYEYINKLIGIEIEKSKVDAILQNLNITILSNTNGELKLEVPAYKVDVTRPADIVEEVIRIVGFDQIPTKENLSSDFLASFPEKDGDFIKNTLINTLIGKGYSEILTNSLTKSSYYNGLTDFIAENHVNILNKLSEDLDIMRRSLIFSGLEVLSHNINRKQSNLKIFEFGKTYQKIEDKYQENNHLAFWLTGNTTDETWQSKSVANDFYQIAEIVNIILEKLNLKDLSQEKFSNELFQYGLKLNKGNKTIATLGLIQKNIAKLAEVKQAVFYADIDFDLLVKYYQNKQTLQEISKFPEVRRDLALVIDKKVTFEEIKKLAIKLEKKLLSNINVFDVFEGEQIGLDKKSYSVSFTLQDKEQTLTDKQIETTMNKLMEGFEKELGAIIRR